MHVSFPTAMVVTALALGTLGMLLIPSHMRLAWTGVAAAVPERLRRRARSGLHA